MKIIFSRKGYDSKYGRGCSPIMPDDGKLVSIPIPTKKDKKDIKGIPYQNLLFDKDLSYHDLMKQLKIKPPEHGIAHLDPDLRKSVKDRLDGWKPTFGQANAAQAHLDKKVKEGDLFLFFGTFKRVISNDLNKWEYDNDYPRHIIFGYLLIGEIHDIGNNGISTFKEKHPELKWAFNHPHLINDYGKNNSIYVAEDSFSNDCKGAGVFKYNDNLVLTKPGYLKSVWELPAFFHMDYGTEISMHKDKSRWRKEEDKTILKTVGMGQEFVVTGNKEIEKWALNLIKSSEVYE